MSNIPFDPDIVKYCDLMEEVKRRIAVIDYFILGQGHALYVPPSLESACLQLRKVLELIAFGSLIANAEAYTSVYSKVSTAVRLRVEQNQLVGVCGEIGILFDALKGA